MTDITPPNSPTSEQAVLGAILIDPEMYKDVKLEGGEFYQERHRWIWDTMTAIIRKGEQPDYVTVCAGLYAAGHLTDLGGPGYITELITNCANSQNAPSYAATVRALARRRSIIRDTSRLAQAAYDLDSDIQAEVSRIIENLSRQVTSVKGAVPLAEIMSKLWDEAAAAAENPQDIYGIPTGFPDWDKMTSGLQYGQVCLLTGEPGIGKSLLAAQVTCNAAAAGYPAAYYSLEMADLQVGRRHWSREAGVSTRSIKSGHVTEPEWEKLTAAYQKLCQLPVFISPDSNISTMDIRVDMCRLADQGVRFAVIDYEALLNDAEGMSDTERSTILSKRTHAIAKDLNIALLVIGDMVKAGMGPNATAKGQTAAAGSGKSLHDRDEVIIMRKDAVNENLIVATWEKLREGDGDRVMKFLKLPGFPSFGSVVKPERK